MEVLNQVQDDADALTPTLPSTLLMTGSFRRRGESRFFIAFRMT
jgi:hypothetical protein